MKKYLLSAVIFISIFIVSGACKSENLKLVKLWETKSEFRTPESVMYDPASDILYVANINGNPTVKDGNGFISKLDLSGNIVKLKWIEGLNAPKGMGIVNNRLYVTDIDQLIEISINKGKIIKRYKAKGAKFLNDIAVDRDGNVYVSDMHANRIYRLAGGKITSWSEAQELNNPNGLFLMKDKLFTGIKNSVLAINIKDKSISFEIKEAYSGGTDGLKSIGNNKFIVSDWSGKIRMVGKDIEPVILSDTSDKKINAADLEYIPGKKMVLVPTFFNNRVVAYELK